MVGVPHDDGGGIRRIRTETPVGKPTALTIRAPIRAENVRHELKLNTEPVNDGVRVAEITIDDVVVSSRTGDRRVNARMRHETVSENGGPDFRIRLTFIPRNVGSWQVTRPSSSVWC